MYVSRPVIVAVCLLLATTGLLYESTTSRAEEDVSDGRPRLTVFSYADGETGFFDHETRTLYIYDDVLRRCVTIRQIKTLGDALEPLRN